MKDAIDILLEVDFNSTAQSLGLQAENMKNLITEENAYRVINEIEILCLREGRDHRIISAMCGLLWTHFSSDFDLLGEYVYSTMSKIGYAPVLPMLKSSQEKKISASSLINALEAETHGRSNTVTALNRKYRLTAFQKRLWEGLEENANIAVSAPTSAGKSFLICLHVVHNAMLRKGVSIYVVPTLSLMNQVANDLADIARQTASPVSIKTRLYAPPSSEPTIFVVTQERIAEYEQVFSVEIPKLDYLVIDEIQNIERAFEYNADDTRSKLLFDVVTDIYQKCAPEKTVISGPRIDEISTLSSRLFDASAKEITTISSPVANVCYSFHPCGAKLEVRQYSDLRRSHNSKIFENTVGATGFGKTTYSDSYHAYLASVTRDLPGTLVFSPTSSQARKTAMVLAGKSQIEGRSSSKLNSLATYIQKTVSPQYALVECVNQAVGYHHGKLPYHVRSAIEYAATRGLFDFLVCTTTLMQGVNLPARNVVLRNPNLFVKRRGDNVVQLSNYEIANLRGRAGRLLRDFVGRTFILDGTTFEEAQAQKSLFEPVHKTVRSSYADVFSENRAEILSSATTGTSSTGGRINSISAYIASIVYTEKDSQLYLARKGIQLRDEEIVSIRKSQTNLIVDPSVVRKHRFWGPHDLDKVGRATVGFDVPINPFSANARGKLGSLLNAMLDIVPEHFFRHIGKRYGKAAPMSVLARLAWEWSHEVPLRSILAQPYPAASSDNTDSTIDLLQHTISFGIPALLSPVYMLKASKASFLTNLEAGAYRAATLLMIGHNVSRETAIDIANSAERKKVELQSIREVVAFVVKNKLSIWDAVQFRHLASVDELISSDDAF